MHESTLDQLPLIFCWTRFGVEAGQSVETILERKDLERKTTDGVFLWGVGTSIAPSLPELLEATASPEVLFSPIKGRPRSVDLNPNTVVRWRAAVTLHGEPMRFPDSVYVLSRPSRGSHYALVCRSVQPLRRVRLGLLDIAALRNLVSGRSVGASQVTAVVSRLPHLEARTTFTVEMRAELVPPYFVRLSDPIAHTPEADWDRAMRGAA